MKVSASRKNRDDPFSKIEQRDILLRRKNINEGQTTTDVAERHPLEKRKYWKKRSIQLAEHPVAQGLHLHS